MPSSPSPCAFHTTASRPASTGLSSLVAAVCGALLTAHSRAETVTIIGTQGTPGISHYYPGTGTLIPGSDGGNGGAGGAASAVANAPGDAVNRATAQGGGGGQGGSGGPGIPNSVSPGRGGDGGPAGSASATATTDKTASGGDVEATAAAYSGSRGYWGIGGGGPETYGTQGAAASAIANASAFTSAGRVTSSASASGPGSGEGGPATAAATGGNTSADPVGVTASAYGGAGRSSPHSSGGNGDQGLLGTVSGSSTGGGRVTVTGNATGGSGGTGVGAGGDGALAHLVNAVTGSTSGDLDLVQNATGGAGGQGTANGGNGAAGLSTLTHTHAGTGVFTSNVQAYGGVGGPALSGSAGNAGPATAQVNATGAGDVNATVGASGGAGGYGPSGTTPGAAATILPSSAISTGTGKTVRLSAYQGGGAGGGWWHFSEATTNGSAGTDSTLTNAVSGAAPGGSLFLTQTAAGGHGGMAVGQTGGRGGDATSSLTFAHSGEAQLNVNVLANAGSAGIANGSNQRNTRGGHATAAGNVQDSGEVNLGLRALAGAGNDGGNANVTGSAISTGAGNVYVGLEASGGTAAATTPNGTPGSVTLSGYGQSAGGDVTVSGTAYGGSGEPVNGTPSLVNGRAITLSNAVGGSTSGVLKLNQVAVGGMGTPDSSTGLKGSGGDATSSLVLPGGNPGGGPLDATITATGGGAANLTDTSPAPTGHATAVGDITNANDVTVYATARAGSSVLGNTVLAKGTGAATSRAVSTRPGGKATAYASTEDRVTSTLSATAETTGTRATLVRAAATGTGPTYSGFSTTARAGAGWNYGTGTLGALGTPASFPPLTFGSNAATALEDMEPLAQVDARSDFATGSATFVLNTAAYAGSVKLALLDAYAFTPTAPLTSFQFTVTRGGTAIVNETFTTWTAAIAWMTDRVIDLGTAAEVNGQPLVFTFTFTGVDAATPANFVTRMVAGAKTAYRTWAESRGVPTGYWINPATYDHDGDGVPLLMEWALGLPPNDYNSLPLSSTLSGPVLEFHYTRSAAAAAAGCLFTVQWNDSLAPAGWQSTGVTQTVLFTTGDVQNVCATIPANGPRGFARLVVEGPP